MENNIYKLIESFYEELKSLSLAIYNKPELAFNEHFASKILCEKLKEYDFDVTLGVGSLDTAFIAKNNNYEANKKTFTFLAEYDALNGLGHACGHNLISVISVFSAIVLSKLPINNDINIVVIGTPAEEHGGGKITLLERGVFEGVDYCLMVHPDNKNQIARYGVGTCDVNVEFYGKGAHSSEPEKGINALQAIINTFNGIDALRTTFPYKANISGIINYGGEAANIIPKYAKATYCIRGAKVSDIYEIIEIIKRVVKGVEYQLGAKAKISHRTPYANRIPNLTIEKLYKKHLEDLGEEVEVFDINKKSGSSDIGNIMQEIPAIHPYIKICDSDICEHTDEFRIASGSVYAHKQVLKAIYSLVNTVIDINNNKEIEKQINNEFNHK